MACMTSQLAAVLLRRGRCPARALMKRRQLKPLAHSWLSLMKNHAAVSKALAWQTKLAQT